MLSPNSKQPSGLECEIAMLGAFISSTLNRAEVLEVCRPEMVEDEKHRAIFTTLSEMFLSQKPIGAYELLVALRSKGAEERVGGADFILTLINQCPDDNGALRAAERVRDFWTRRRVASALEDLKHIIVTTDATGERLNAADVMNRLSATLSTHDSGKSIIDAADHVDEYMSVRPSRSLLPGIGIPSFDRSMSLFRPGEVTIVAGRPGGGKSSLMRQIVWRASTSNPALVFTLEVTPKTLIQQLCCEAAGVPFEIWRDGVIVNEAEANAVDSKIVDAIAEFGARKIKIYTKARVAAIQVGIALSQLRAEALTPSVIVIDYLGLMDHGKAERNDIAIGQTTRALKLLALEQNVPIVLLCQMNRESEKRGTGAEHDRPRLADLRDSGNIEQDADNIIFLWKKEKDDNRATTQARVLTIAKHRNGHTGDIDVMFDMPGGRFFEMYGGSV